MAETNKRKYRKRCASWPCITFIKLAAAFD